jgi:hypothetical protein
MKKRIQTPEFRITVPQRPLAMTGKEGAVTVGGGVILMEKNLYALTLLYVCSAL